MINAWVVFEEIEMRELVAFALSGLFGMNVRVASSEEEILLELVGSARFDLLVCDETIPVERVVWAILAEGLRLQLFKGVGARSREDETRVPFRGKEWISFLRGPSLISDLEMAVRRKFPSFSPNLSNPQTPLDSPTPSNRYSKISYRIIAYLTFSGGPLQGDLFIKGGAQGGEEEWVKVAAEGSVPDLKKLEGAFNEGRAPEFYVETDKVRSVCAQIEELIQKRREQVRLFAQDIDLDEGQNEGEESLDSSGSLMAKKKRLEYLKARVRVLDQEKAKLEEIDQEK